MSRACTICTNPQRDAIDAAIRAREPHQAIAAQYGVTRDSVRRHALSHLPEIEVRKRAERATAPKNRTRTQGQNIPPDELGITQATFLAAFVRDCNESAALRAAHVDRTTVRYWEEHSDEFSRRYNEARRQVDDAIDGEVARRALHGDAEPVVSSGKVMRNDDGSIMTVQKYSDRMLELLAKAHHPKYREKQTLEVQGKDGGPIQSQQTVALDVRGMSAEQLVALRQVLEAGQ